LYSSQANKAIKSRPSPKAQAACFVLPALIVTLYADGADRERMRKSLYKH